METKAHPAHPWRARFVISSVMLLLGLIGLVIADVRHNGALLYWKWITPVYGVLAISLSWYLHHRKEDFRPLHLLQEVFHWAAAVAGVYILNMFVAIGIMGRFEAALAVIVTLGLATFMAGLYIESTLIIVGILLGLFAAGVAIVDEYLYSIMIPVTIIAIIILLLITRRKSKVN
ncbi:MAG: hypothetical protein KDK44_03080 [Chlamydiia bacterium]|nr:hypothetical protein [Chlamydiia bacterium]MCP5509016.1 hypothetical protein [Chlamydiales bacterium]